MSESAPKGAPEAATAKRQARRHLTPTDPHDVYMFGMAWRIRWLNRHRHWYLRTPEGRAQLEFIERRDAA